MEQNDPNNGKGEYVLAKGQAASRRLQILHNIYGPGARRVLIDAGIRPECELSILDAMSG